MIPLESKVGKAMFAVRKWRAEKDSAEHMLAVFPGEEWRTKLDKARRNEKRALEHLTDTIMDAYRHIPSDVLKDLK